MQKKSTDNHYNLLNKHTIPPTIIITIKHTHNSTDNHYALLEVTTMPPTIIINF